MTTAIEAIEKAEVEIANAELAIEAANAAYVASVEAMLETDTDTETQRDNTATPYARLTLARLLNEPAFTIDSAIATAVSVYQPLTKSGKPTATLGGLAGSGKVGNAIASRIKSLDKINRNIGNGKVRALVDLFILQTGNAQGETFGALVKACDKAIADAAPKPIKAPKVEKETPLVLPDAPPVPVTLADKVNFAVQALGTATVEELASASDAIADLRTMLAMLDAPVEMEERKAA